MKMIKIFMLAAFLSLTVLTPTTGCKSAGQIIMTASITVDSAMKAWAVYVVDGHATKEQENLVRELKEQYDLTEQIALGAYMEYFNTGEKSEWLRAKSVLVAQQGKLISLISAFTGGKL